MCFYIILQYFIVKARLRGGLNFGKKDLHVFWLLFTQIDAQQDCASVPLTACFISLIFQQ